MCFDGHDRLTPSLSFLPDKGIWKCFGCGKCGDSIELVKEVLGCDFKTALDWFAREFGIGHDDFGGRGHHSSNRLKSTNHREELSTLPSRMPEESKFAPYSEVYSWLMNLCSHITMETGVKYLDTHGISLEVASRFGVRELCSPTQLLQHMVKRWGKDRIIRSGLVWEYNGEPQRLIWSSYTILFPFYSGDLVTYIQGRLFVGEPKFLNPRGIEKPLYNAERLTKLKLGSVVFLCEGVPDVIALEGRGHPALGVLGATSFRREWVDLLMRFDVVLLGDGDRGGDQFKHIVSGLFKDRGKAVRTAALPTGRDVADVLASKKGKK